MDLRRAFGILAITACACATFAPEPAFGQSSSTMPVSLTVRPACTVEASPLVFGGFEGSSIDAESRIAVTCNTDTAVRIGLDTGANAAGTERRLAGSTGYVPYAIYSEASRRTPWDAGTSVGATVEGGMLQLIAYGRVEQGATYGSAGNFTDNVTVTVDF